ncbi:diguanylate cyclase (GGDEF)-like protein [Comamonas sp. BIGb0124]|nr:diguanylate cyclase (GGDEF)-like protein [Comamonas sp. BIGb0124]
MGLALLVVLVTFANTFYAGYLQQREMLIRNTLESNQAYATKAAGLTDGFLQQALSQLGYSAQLLGSGFDSPAVQSAETRRLLQQNQTYNSVVIVNAAGKVLNISPPMAEVVGQQIGSSGMLAALQARQPLVSEPFVAGTGRLVIFISHPVFAPGGEYLGFIGGSVYLHDQNALHAVLGQHHFLNGSYLFVVDRQGRLIFHRDQERVGENVMRNRVVQSVIQRNEAGSAESVNTRGESMLSGYAPVGLTGWGVVVQRPTELTLDVLPLQVQGMLWKVAPLLVATLLAIWALARWIAKPLHDLARIANRLDDADTAGNIAQVPSWYYEVIKLKQAILAGLSQVQRRITRLNTETVTDPLTGLLNRRGMMETLQAWEEAGRPFSVAVIDIDHFKSINDTYGHDAGDTVLRFLADHMRRAARAGDVLCRQGGDEFTLLLPATPAHEAVHACERLTHGMAFEHAYPGVTITLSIGVADFRREDIHVNGTLKAADVALYQAKRRGRNQLVEAERA